MRVRKTGKNAVTVLMGKQKWMKFSIPSICWLQIEKGVICIYDNE